MLVSLYRLADRLGRIVVKSGLKVGESVGWATGRGRRSRTPAVPVRADGAARPAGPRPLISIALTPQQLPAVVLLLLINIGLVAAATLLIEGALRPELPAVVALAT